MNNDARVQSDEALRGGQQWVDINLFDPWLFYDKPAEAHHELIKICQRHRLFSAYAFERGENVGLLHHAARQGCVEWRQAEGAVFVYLDQNASRTEQQHRSELRVDAAAHDQLVTIAGNHGLNGHSLEMSCARLFPHASLDGCPGTPHRGFVLQIQLHAADVGFVSNSFRMQLQDYRIPDFAGEFDGAVRRVRDHGPDRRNPIERQQLLGFR